MPRRLIIEDSEGQSAYDLLDEVTVIGRDPECDLPIDDDRLSRRHLKITQLGDDLLAEDLGSSNGSHLDGDPISGKVLLESGSRIEVGSVIVWVDRAPLRSSGDAPPATRRQASDRKKKNNSVPIIVTIVALLLVGFYVLKENQGSSEPNRSNDREVAQETEEKQDRPETENATANNKKSALSEEDIKNLRARTRALSDLDFELEALLLQDDFVGASDLIAIFRRKHGKPGRAIMRKYDQRVKTAFDKILSEYQKQVTAGAPEVAIAVIRDRIDQFPSHEKEHKELLSILNRRGEKFTSSSSASVAKKANASTLRQKRPEVGKPLIKNKARNKDEKEAAEARFVAENAAGDRFMGQRRYTEAARAFRKSSEAGLTGQVDHELLRVSMRKMRQAERLAAFGVAVQDMIAKDATQFGEVTFLPGRRGKILGVGENGIIFDESGAQTEIPFRVLRAETLRAMITKGKFEGVDRIHAAAFLLSMNEILAAEKLLHRAEKQTPNLKRQINATLADARSIEIPDDGFTFKDGRYLSPGDLARVNIRETVQKCLPMIKDEDLDTRAEGYAQLRQLGDRAASAFHRALIEAKTEVVTGLKKNEKYSQLAKLDEQRIELDKRRAHALELIFDTYKYPYPYRGVPQEVTERFLESKKEVAIRVKAVREVWEQNKEITIDQSIRKAVAKIDEYNLELDRLDLGRGTSDPRCLQFLPKINKVSLQTFAIDAADRERIDTSLAWMKRNAEVESIASAEERKQVLVTNEYRLMMGRHAVKMHDKLVECARMHSNDMAKGGWFSHDNPKDPQKRTPNDRARLVGFTGGVSENIAQNGGGAIGAHNAWLGSSGHHRNILGKNWRYLGSGNSGRLWTQNFSSSDG